MKKLIAIALTLLSSLALSQALTITNFGSASTGGAWSFNTGTGEFNGAGNAGDFLFETFSTFDLTGITEVIFDMSADTPVPGSISFSVVFRESLGGTDVASVSFSSAQLTAGSPSSTLTDLGGNFANVNAFLLSAAGAPGDNFDLTLNSFTAVPEPSAFALLAGCFGMAWVMVRRRA